jgi:hypothetical protein
MLGRTVAYTLSRLDAEMINGRRLLEMQRGGHLKRAWAAEVHCGDMYPLEITRDWGDGRIDGKVLLGDETHYVNSVPRGAGPNTWST